MKIPQIFLKNLIPTTYLSPSPVQGQVILAVTKGMPQVLFWLDKQAWETESGEIVMDFDAWIYLQS